MIIYVQSFIPEEMNQRNIVGHYKRVRKKSHRYFLSRDLPSTLRGYSVITYSLFSSETSQTLFNFQERIFQNFGNVMAQLIAS